MNKVTQEMIEKDQAFENRCKEYTELLAKEFGKVAIIGFWAATEREFTACQIWHGITRLQLIYNMDQVAHAMRSEAFAEISGTHYKRLYG